MKKALALILALLMVCSMFAGCGKKDDAGVADEGTTDGAVDTGAEDAGTTDEGTSDEGTTDEGTTDEGTTDEGTEEDYQLFGLRDVHDVEIRGKAYV